MAEVLAAGEFVPATDEETGSTEPDKAELCETGTTKGKEELEEVDNGEFDSEATGAAELEVAEDPESEDTGITTRELLDAAAGDDSEVIEGIYGMDELSKLRGRTPRAEREAVPWADAELVVPDPQSKSML